MGVAASLDAQSNMASRWRRRRMCVLIADNPSPAALRQVSAAGAFLETNARPTLGASVELHHPDAGAIEAEVSSLAHDGIGLAFRTSERSVAFALAAIAADMSRPAA
ncbi:hypothetical protein [Allosphingosinicella sp.]|uniref:hypothetical protein n=1 Tax=Allosphingosinicella sp. TaxID=2823234 RepID=UPI003783286F